MVAAEHAEHLGKFAHQCLLVLAGILLGLSLPLQNSQQLGIERPGLLPPTPFLPAPAPFLFPLRSPFASPGAPALGLFFLPHPLSKRGFLLPLTSAVLAHALGRRHRLIAYGVSAHGHFVTLRKMPVDADDEISTARSPWSDIRLPRRGALRAS